MQNVSYFELATFHLDSGFNVSVMVISECDRVENPEFGHLSSSIEEMVAALRKTLKGLRKKGWSIDDGTIDIVKDQFINFLDDLFNLPGWIRSWRNGPGEQDDRRATIPIDLLVDAWESGAAGRVGLNRNC
jgi:hypothetical protein